MLSRYKTNSITCRNNKQFIWADDGVVTNCANTWGHYYDQYYESIDTELQGVARYVSVRATTDALITTVYNSDVDLFSINKSQNGGMSQLVFMLEADNAPSILIDALDDLVVIVDRDVHKLHMYDYAGTNHRSHYLNYMGSIDGLHVLPDGNCALLSDGYWNCVTKLSVKLDIFGMETIWVCEDIPKPTGISSDKYGLIYVGSEHSSIYILSPQGVFDS